MRKILLSVFLAAGLMVGGGNVFAGETGEYGNSQTKHKQTERMSDEAFEVTGTVVSAQDSILKVRGQDGVMHTIEITGAQDLEQLDAETLQPGDRVHVDFIRKGEGRFHQGDEVIINKIGEGQQMTKEQRKKEGMRGIWVTMVTIEELGMETGMTQQPSPRYQITETIRNPSYSGTVTGLITLVGNNVIEVWDDQSGVEYELKVSESQEKKLTTGHRGTFQVNNGKVASYELLGVPQNVAQKVYSIQNLSGESTVTIQKWMSEEEIQQEGMTQ